MQGSVGCQITYRSSAREKDEDQAGSETPGDHDYYISASPLVGNRHNRLKSVDSTHADPTVKARLQSFSNTLDTKRH
jgi:hypothetical protein